MQTDGTVLAAGGFRTLAGRPWAYLARVNSDGRVDESFQPEPNGAVVAIGMQADGRILVGGDFTKLAGKPHAGLGRLNHGGSVDSSFVPEANGRVCCLVEQADGCVLVGGLFTTVNGQARSGIARLTPAGLLDPSFAAVVGDPLGVSCVVLQPDGRILVAGDFLTLNGVQRYRLGRLHADGTLDARFNPRASGSVHTLALQANGAILVGGAFGRVGGLWLYGLARLNNDGEAESWFSPGAGGYSVTVSALAVQRDGGSLLGGVFGVMGGALCTNVARLRPDEPALRTLEYDGLTLTWRLAGSSPAVAQAIFEVSDDGIAWSSLGVGTWSPGGWQLGDVAVKAGRTIRARGLVVGGYRAASSWFLASRVEVGEETGGRCRLKVELRGGVPALAAIGAVGCRYELESVPVLVPVGGWTTLASFMLTNSPQIVADPAPGLNQSRFYRLRLAEPRASITAR